MKISQHTTARFSNLLALAVIVLAGLSVLSVGLDALPQKIFNHSCIAEVCIGQRILEANTHAVWLQGIWVTAPPLPKYRVTGSGIDYNNPGTVCGLIPWWSQESGWWYREIGPKR